MRKLAHWLEYYTPTESVDILRDFAWSHAARSGKFSHDLKRLLRREEFRKICEFDVDYSCGDQTPYELAELRQCLAFFSKLEHLDIGIDKEEVAWQKFTQSERDCRETNSLFKQRAAGTYSFRPAVEHVLSRARRKILSVLGDVPALEELGLRFGPGATTLTKKRHASLREKFRAGISCSEELLPAASRLLSELPHLSDAAASLTRVDEEGEEWASVPIVIHDGKLDFVPKNAKTYRAVVTEPVLNGLYQLALGDYMSRRLAAFGVDLRDQTRNQRLARQGSFTGALATLDLSSASDTISREVVYDLLPLEWAYALSRARTGHVTRKGTRITLEKFSSMGNGFTFPLESLIFWAITHAACDGHPDVSVYGDDIVCPTSHYTLVVECLTAVGFTVNEKKSYATGLFRESCGRDYYGGIDIRPFYQKSWVNGMSLFSLHNFYVRKGESDLAERVRAFVHPDNLLFGPDGYGDGHLLGAHEPRRKRRFIERGLGGYLFDTFTLRGRRDLRGPLRGDFVLPTYSIYRRREMEDPIGLLPRTQDDLRRSIFRAIWERGHGSMADSLPLPDHKSESGDIIKATSLPGDDGYKRVSIYTFGE